MAAHLTWEMIYAIYILCFCLFSQPGVQGLDIADK